MNPTKIPRIHKYNDITFFDNYIKNDAYSDYFIPYDEIDLILNKFPDESKLVLYYVIYEILVQNDINPKLSNVPKNGIELKNPNTQKGYSIYHVHLDNKMVLMWYVSIVDGYYLNFICIEHPSDDYEYILDYIYNKNDGGFNFDQEDYFNNITKILNENIITDFNNFIILNEKKIR